jgi:hypothetical protein
MITSMVLRVHRVVVSFLVATVLMAVPAVGTLDTRYQCYLPDLKCRLSTARPWLWGPFTAQLPKLNLIGIALKHVPEPLWKRAACIFSWDWRIRVAKS